jgi:hypothetical protein
MTRAEVVEVIIIIALIAAVWLLPGPGVWTIAFGKAVAYSAALLLAQGLIRDIARLAFARRAEGEKRRIMCLCAESTLGLILIVMGLGLTLIGIQDVVTLGPVGRTVLVAAILVIGFIAKDYVVSIRKERDHASVIVW